MIGAAWVPTQIRLEDLGDVRASTHPKAKPFEIEIDMVTPSPC